MVGFSGVGQGGFSDRMSGGAPRGDRGAFDDGQSGGRVPGLAGELTKEFFK